MRKNLTPDHSFEEGHGGLVCNECGEEFPKPILATVSSNRSSQTYLACPNCLSKVANTETHKDNKTTETSVLETKVKNVKLVSESKIECKHFFGYLGKRPQNTPIPEDCLICEKMVECLIP